MKQIYHHYNKWECLKYGMYTNEKITIVKVNDVIDFFNNEEMTREYMGKVTKEWPVSCEHFLSKKSINRIAWIGQASASLKLGVSQRLTMNAWNYLSCDIQERSDKVANKTIRQWEQNQILKNTYQDGRRKDTITEYQMRLQFT